MDQKKKVILACGGSGGHLYPAQELALQLIREGIEVSFIGVDLDKSSFLSNEFRRCSLPGAPLKNPIRSTFLHAKGLLKSLSFMRRQAPHLIIGFGSYHSFTPLLAARLLKTPYLIFEANSVLGRVNRLFVKKAQKSLSFFPHSEMVRVKMPIRCKRATKDEALKHYGLEKEKCTLLICGGSQGALSLNQLFMKALKEIPSSLRHFQIIHITGLGKKEGEAKRLYSAFGIKNVVIPFELEMHYAYAASDLVLARAGAGTIADLVAYERPALLIPYPFETDGHQTKNAAFMKLAVGGAEFLSEKDLTPEKLAENLLNIMRKKEPMKKAISFFKANDHRKELSEYLLKEYF
ncbi:MAG: UDP-N-acetylglucosamine--N-acetylmuramyl-(pentapeptide) pyrophosphoryl-undecaprenol N-acetylglucosamine transferase [Simkaniaceae bacterium]